YSGDFQNRLTQPAMRSVNSGQGNSRYRSGQSEGQIDQRVEDSLPRETVSDQDPGHHSTKDGVDRRGHQREAKANFKGGNHPRRSDSAEKCFPTKSRGLQKSP